MSGPGAGRRRRRDEYRHDGAREAGKHGRSRQRSDEAHRNSSRSASKLLMTPRRLDYLFDRQLIVAKVFRYHSGHVRRLLSAIAGLERHAPRTPHKRHFVGDPSHALIIVALIPLALKGVPYRPVGAATFCAATFLIYGVGGLDRSFRRHQTDRCLPSVRAV